MKIIQFAYSQGVPSGVPLVDCRLYMSNCFSEAAARAHPAFESVVQKALSILDAEGQVAIGCAQGKHRSQAVAREVSARTGIEVTHYKGRSDADQDSTFSHPTQSFNSSTQDG